MARPSGGGRRAGDGLERGQVAALVAWEAVLVAVVGAVTGALAGSGVGVVVGAVLTRRNVGVVTVGVPWAELAAVVALTGVAAFVAAAGLARRAGRLEVLAVLAAL